MIITKYVS